MPYGPTGALVMSLLAGLATVVGAGFAILFSGHMKPVSFAMALAFASGCTLTVAFADVLPEGQEVWTGMQAEDMEEKYYAIGLLIVLAGWLIATAFDTILHVGLDAYDNKFGGGHIGVCAHDHYHDHSHTNHEVHDAHHGHYHLSEPTEVEHSAVVVVQDSLVDAKQLDAGEAWWSKALRWLFMSPSTLTKEEEQKLNERFVSDAKKITRLGYFTACVLALHNIPEGIALYSTATSDNAAGIGLAVAIALHNLPQGMAIAVPIHIGLKSAWKALGFALAAGLAQLLGALIGFAMVGSHPTESVMSVMLLLTAGILLNASVKELYAAAVRYDLGNQVVHKFIFIGMVIMVITLVILAYAS